MKKQILFLAFFVAAILAGTSTAFGQLLPGVTDPNGTAQAITPLSCATSSEPLHPIPYQTYTYSLTNGSGATSANWTWWITQDPSFITAEGTLNMAGMLTQSSGQLYSAPASPAYGNDNSGTTDGSGSIDIAWTPEILSLTKYQAEAADAPKKSTFIVAYSEGVDGCSDNMQVYEINPQPNFIIDIAPIDPSDELTTLAWDATDVETCVDQVQSASYNTTTHELDIDYGTNTLYFEVAAANFTTNWTPSFSIVSGLLTDQSAVMSMYTTLTDAKAGSNALATSGTLLAANMSSTPGTFSWEPGVALTANSVDDVASGVSVFVKVVITNNHEESLVDNPFVLAVDAQDNSETGIWDMEDADCTALDDNPDAVDQATITVTPRPTLNHYTNDSGTPEPTNRVPKEGHNIGGTDTYFWF